MDPYQRRLGAYGLQNRYCRERHLRSASRICRLQQRQKDKSRHGQDLPALPTPDAQILRKPSQILVSRVERLPRKIPTAGHCPRTNSSKDLLATSLEGLYNNSNPQIHLSWQHTRISLDVGTMTLSFCRALGMCVAQWRWSVAATLVFGWLFMRWRGSHWHQQTASLGNGTDFV